MRISKDADERREEILNRSMELFVMKGYDNTSVSDILKAVNIAKGTLYYYFESKEEILNGIVERIGERRMLQAKQVADCKEIPLLERIGKTLRAFQIQGEEEKQILSQAHKPQNALMNQKILRIMLKDTVPVLTGLVKEGVKEGIFRTEHPQEVVEMLIVYGNIIFDAGFVELTKEEEEKKMKAFIELGLYLLGMDPGEFKFPEKLFG